LSEIGFRPNGLWLKPGTAGAQERLSAFLAKIDRYKSERDFPALDSTSGLSVHLRHGTVSVRQCFREAVALQGNGPSKWLDELVWREFYHMILANFPHVVDRPFRDEYDTLEWPGTQEAYEAWEEGRTGYPLVDAAMRCLRATGWMHNRLRMVTAMFLTKDLLVDYRRGESLFARWLLDFELASNNGGWQWSASTGVDAQPYFRIFNPILQSRKFDPEAVFIKQWCPELAGFEPELAHWPHDAGPIEQLAAGCQLGKDYPRPIVDHSVQRQLAIELLSRKS
jgi:deoxyribodipyrimidine photo-lyase